MLVKDTSMANDRNVARQTITKNMDASPLLKPHHYSDNPINPEPQSSSLNEQSSKLSSMLLKEGETGTYDSRYTSRFETWFWKKLLKNDTYPLFTEDHHEDFKDLWKPGIISRFPWSGIFSLIGVLLCAIASALTLHLSEGNTVGNGRWYAQPTTRLALLSAVSKPTVWLSVFSTLGNAFLGIALSQGITITSTIVYGPHSSPAKHFNVVAFATIFSTTMMAISGPLLQSASYVVNESVNSTVTLSAMIAGTVPWGTNADQVFQDRLDGLPCYANFSGCQGLCHGEVQASGLAVDCQLSQGATYNLSDIVTNASASNQVVFSSFFEILNNGYFDYGLLWSAQYLDGSASCVGNFINRTCSFQEALVTYQFDLDYGIISNLAVVAPNPSSNFTPYFPEDEMAHIILPWVQELFDSNTIILSTGFKASDMLELSMTGFIAYEYLQALDNMLDATNLFLRNETCSGITWNDPTADIVEVVEDLAFRLALFASNESINFTGGYQPDGGTDSILQDIQVTQILLEQVYRADWVYLWVALAVIIFATASVTPTFYGWWELGRTVSFSPLEIAKAFNAPILMDVPSNRDIDAMLKELDGVKVRYGERSVDTSNGMDYERALPKKLEMADLEWVSLPRLGHRYNG